ncbi:hypothetical protein GCK32_005967, partial [Trichostrongylus colubriformis]
STSTISDPINYIYVSAAEVADLREAKGSNRNQFALALEKMAYRDDPRELQTIVDERIHSKDRVRFIKQCVFKYYEVPEHLQDSVWKSIKEALNSRVRRLRRALREGQARPQQEEGADPFALDD